MAELLFGTELPPISATQQVGSRPDLGAPCHFRQDTNLVPVAIVTDLKGNIIVSNDVNLDSGNNFANPTPIGWAVSGVKILLTRFWAAASATIVLVCNQTDLDAPLPKRPSKLRAEREICIYLGYIDSVRPVTTDDLYSDRLLRVFVGLVDTSQDTLAQGGNTITIPCRDRMKWLMDTDVTYSAALGDTRTNDLSRSKIIKELAQRGIGYIEGRTDVTNGNEVIGNGKKILAASPPYLKDLGEELKNGVTSSVILPDAWYREGQPLAGITSNKSNLKVAFNPFFRIFTTRAPITSTNVANFLVNQQKPLDMIKFLTFQEVFPTEVFQDHRDGNLYYTPRASDATSLKDPKRFYRTYFYRTYPQPNAVTIDTLNPSDPQPLPPDINQMLFAFREEESSIGCITDFVVHKSSPVENGTVKDDWVIHLKIVPEFLREDDGSIVPHAAKYMRIFDQTIKSTAEAGAVLLNAARIYGKEARAAMCITLGDSSFTPGEIIQVIGGMSSPRGGLDQVKEDRDIFTTFNERYNTNFADYVKKTLRKSEKGDIQPGEQVDLQTFDGRTASFKVDKFDKNGLASGRTETEVVYGNSSSSIISGTPEREPKTIFRVEAVLHRFNVGSKGFTTELALSSPF